MLQKTRFLQNFVSSDRAFLAELALLGRFETCEERLFKKRFHRQVSWALNQRRVEGLSEHRRQGLFAARPTGSGILRGSVGQPIRGVEKMVCNGMVALHCLKVFGQALTMKDRRNAARAVAWRQNKPDPGEWPEARRQSRTRAAPPMGGMTARQTIASSSRPAWTGGLSGRRITSQPSARSQRAGCANN